MTESFQYIKGMYRHFKNKPSIVKYGFKVSIAPSERKHITFFEDVCKGDEEVAKILGIMLAYNEIYYGGVTKRECYSLLEGWKNFLRTTNPYESFGLKTIEDYQDFLAEGMMGSQAFIHYKRGNLHPVAFCILLDIFDVSDTYKNLDWRLEKVRIQKLREALKSLHTYQQLVFRTNDYFETLGE